MFDSKEKEKASVAQEDPDEGELAFTTLIEKKSKKKVTPAKTMVKTSKDDSLFDVLKHDT